MAKPKFLILDVDGVMTTGQFIYSTQGKMYKVFGPHDSDGLKLLQDKLGIIFITADKRGFEITHKRIVDDMGYPLHLVTEDERQRFFEQRFPYESTIFIGDGIFDAPILKKCVCGIAPANARVEARESADFVTPSASANGAVLDACLYIDKTYFSEQ